MNTLICTKCKRLWVPETGKTCPKCGGTLTDVTILAKASSQNVPDDIRMRDLSKKLITLDERKTS